MTLVQMAAIVGKKATLSIDGFHVPVVISDVRKRYGNVDYEVTPIGGAGTRWVSSERVKVDGV